MIKQAMSEAGLGSMAAVGVTAFVAIFAVIVAWTLTRGRGQVRVWSSLPLSDGIEPVEPREGPKRPCGECDQCECITTDLSPS